MFNRAYCFSFVAISGLLFSFLGNALWSWVMLCIGIVPLVISFKEKMVCYKLLLSIFIFIGFYFYGTWTTESIASSLTGKERTFYGRITSEPTLTSSLQHSFEIELTTGERLQVFSSIDDSPPSLGSTCTFQGQLTSPKSATNPYGFHYDKYLNYQGIQWILSLDKEASNCTIETGSFWSGFLSYRKETIAQFMESKDQETAALMTALVFGERSHISEARVTAYRQLGIIHLLAVSGLHVGMLTFTLFYFFCRIGMTREKASIILILILPCYIVIAGGAPSVVRASLMCLLLLVVSLFRFKVKAINVIALICYCLLVYDPLIIFQLGFQLSFLTSFALLLSNRLLQNNNRFIILLKVTFIAQLISMPLSLYHFFEISFLSLPINLLFIPFISMWILPLSFITLIFEMLFPPFALIPFKVASISIQIAHGIIDIFSSWNWDMIVFGKPSDWLIVCLYIAILFFLVTLENKNGKIMLVSGGLLVSLFAFQLFFPLLQTHAIVTYLDVGQGDAIVIELPRRKGVYLIDTGGDIFQESKEEENENRKGPGKQVIEPFLKGKGIGKINKLILTHGHLDHIGETCEIVEIFPVETIIYPRVQENTKEASMTFQCIGNKIPIQWAMEGQGWRVKNNRFAIVNPVGYEKSENEQSIVLYANIEGVSFLFTGDIEKETENRLAQSYNNLQVDILKVAHHGSNSSSTSQFLEITKPKIGVISVGRNNLYGHPNLEALRRLEENNVQVFRTDTNGAIQIIVKDGRFLVRETVK